jgi:peptide/nickel transport system substrate-binding protein
LTLKPAVVQGGFCLYFPDQWDPKSPWHGERVRRAASLAIDREGANEALTLGYSLITGNPIVPDHHEFFGSLLRRSTARKKPSSCSPKPDIRKASTQAITIATRRTRTSGRPTSTICMRSAFRPELRPIERAAFIKGFAEKTFNEDVQ